MLRLDGVEAAYGPSRVLHGVTLEAREGEVVSLLGRNGAGKSTTLKAIMGLVQVTGGSISLDGQALQELPTHEISRLGVGWVPEDRRIFSDLTVAENLLVGAKGGSGWSVSRVFEYFPAPSARAWENTRRRARHRCSRWRAPSWAIRVSFSSTSP